MLAMHRWDERTDLLAHSVIGYAIERLKMPKDPTWGARPADQLAAALEGAICPEGIGGHEALALFRDVLMHACRPMDHPMNLGHVPTAPTPAANLFDLVVSASSIFAGLWECGAGAIAAENQALQWLAGLAGFPDGAGGCFVTGGSAANLSALVTARHHARARHGDPSGGRWRFATTGETHASVHAAARVMDVDVVLVPPDERGRMTGAALRATLDDNGVDGLFAVVANFGTTNAGAVDELDAVADVCRELEVWMHIDAAYGGAALCAPSTVDVREGFERADSFGIDPHKWLFAPYDCAALVYRDPSLAAGAHAQQGDVPRHRQPRGVEPERLRLPPLAPGARPAAVVQRGHPRHRRLRRGGRRRRWRRRAGSPPSSSGATASRCCSNRSCRSPCSRSTAGTTPATRRGARAGRGPGSPSSCRPRGTASAASGCAW